MKALDRFIQNYRIDKVRRYLQPGARVLDIGCADGALFRRIPGIGTYIGMDPALEQPVQQPPLHLIRGTFPDHLPDHDPFDAITMLAVLEHFPADQYERLARECAAHLKPGGYLLITVPSALVDRILDLLRWVGLIDGMALEEHHGFSPGQTPAIFAATDLELVKRQRFQLGLNNLFVFRRRMK
jgi:2-polyprenyl-3-methyl-5-hydroxy-6-metoxy-1,4-benzoquinol methylase